MFFEALQMIIKPFWILVDMAFNKWNDSRLTPAEGLPSHAHGLPRYLGVDHNIRGLDGMDGQTEQVKQ